MPDTSPITLAVDQGTSSTKAAAVDRDGTFLRKETVPISQAHQQPGWVEQDAEEILDSVLLACRRLLDGLERPVLALGLSTQRESAVVWERSSGKPVGPMLGWQDRRTGKRAQQLLEAGHGPECRRITGLPIDPMFSALKLAWLLDEVDPDRRRSDAGELAVGTVDSYLVYRLTGQHQIEAGNASRTLLMDVETAAWSPQLLELFRIPEAVLPRIVPSNTHTPLQGGLGLPSTSIDGVLGDSHAALYGHGVRKPGAVKDTFGTGSSVMGLLPTGAEVSGGLARTVAWQLGAQPTLAFEGNILATGATLVWLSTLLETNPGALVDLAATVAPLHGVNLVPAFAGLAAPWWSETAEASLTGFTLGTDRATIARAAVDSIALQIEDVLTAAETGPVSIDTVLVDGGPTANSWLVQHQADLSQRSVRRSTVPELSALGAAQLASESAGQPIESAGNPDPADSFRPHLDATIAHERRSDWQHALGRVLGSNPTTHPVDAAVNS